MNSAGDVLLALGTAHGGSSAQSVRVRRADGALLGVGPLTYSDPPQARGTDLCCHLAADLTEGRLALGTTVDGPGTTKSAILDVAAGRVVDSADVRLLTLNARRQTAGVVAGGFGNAGRALVTVGLPAPASPAGPAARTRDPLTFRWSTLVPIDLDDDPNLLASACGNPAYLPAAGPGVWLDRIFGQMRAVRMSRHGGWLAALDSAGALHVWRPGTPGPLRVAVPGDAWRFDAFGAINPAGAIAAHGVERASGRRAALLLEPTQ